MIIKFIYALALLLPPFMQVKLRYYFGREKQRELKSLKKVLSKGDVVIDVGAHRGIYTYYVQKIVGNSGLVYSIEPQIFYFNYLRSAFRKSRNINIINAAALDRITTTSMFIPVHNVQLATGGASLKKVSAINNRFVVKTMMIDDLNLVKCNLIKIDVEGSELSIIRGALSTLDKYRPILLIELDYGLAGSELMQTVQILRNYKYKPYLIHKNRFHALAYSDFGSPKINRKFGYDAKNFFFIHNKN
jgi:FkbM family methyltransferase